MPNLIITKGTYDRFLSLRPVFKHRNRLHPPLKRAIATSLFHWGLCLPSGILSFMTRLKKNDLIQMNRDYFQSLEKERLVEVGTNLHSLAVEQWEKLQQNSNNSSQPPSSDNPYQKGDSQEKEKASIESTEPETNTEGKEISTPEEDSYQNEASGGSSAQNAPTLKKSPGHPPGTPSQWRSSPLVAEVRQL